MKWSFSSDFDLFKLFSTMAEKAKDFEGSYADADANADAEGNGQDVDESLDVEVRRLRRLSVENDHSYRHVLKAVYEPNLGIGQSKDIKHGANVADAERGLNAEQVFNV